MNVAMFRLRFSLRTLLVLVTLFCIWLGWCHSTVRQRDAKRTWIQEKGGVFQEWVVPENPAQWIATTPKPYVEKYRQISKVTTWLGDRPVSYINLVHTDATWEERQLVAKMFPEAFVVPERPRKTQKDL